MQNISQDTVERNRNLGNRETKKEKEEGGGGGVTGGRWGRGRGGCGER